MDSFLGPKDSGWLAKKHTPSPLRERLLPAKKSATVIHEEDEEAFFKSKFSSKKPSSSSSSSSKKPRRPLRPPSFLLDQPAEEEDDEEDKQIFRSMFNGTVAPLPRRPVAAAAAAAPLELSVDLRPSQITVVHGKPLVNASEEELTEYEYTQAIDQSPVEKSPSDYVDGVKAYLDEKHEYYGRGTDMKWRRYWLSASKFWQYSSEKSMDDDSDNNYDGEYGPSGPARYYEEYLRCHVSWLLLGYFQGLQRLGGVPRRYIERVAMFSFCAPRSPGSQLRAPETLESYLGRYGVNDPRIVTPCVNSKVLEYPKPFWKFDMLDPGLIDYFSLEALKPVAERSHGNRDHYYLLALLVFYTDTRYGVENKWDEPRSRRRPYTEAEIKEKQDLLTAWVEMFPVMWEYFKMFQQSRGQQCNALIEKKRELYDTPKINGTKFHTVMDLLISPRHQEELEMMNASQLRRFAKDELGPGACPQVIEYYENAIHIKRVFIDGYCKQELEVEVAADLCEIPFLSTDSMMAGKIDLVLRHYLGSMLVADYKSSLNLLTYLRKTTGNPTYWTGDPDRLMKIHDLTRPRGPAGISTDLWKYMFQVVSYSYLLECRFGPGSTSRYQFLVVSHPSEPGFRVVIVDRETFYYEEKGTKKKITLQQALINAVAERKKDVKLMAEEAKETGKVIKDKEWLATHYPKKKKEWK